MLKDKYLSINEITFNEKIHRERYIVRKKYTYILIRNIYTYILFLAKT